MILEELIGTLGFPIAITAYLLYERSKQTVATREDKNKTIAVVTNALVNNTEALVALKETIESMGD